MPVSPATSSTHQHLMPGRSGPGFNAGAMYPTGMGYMGRPIRFTSGQFSGRTIRAELQEIQKADLGRKYAKVDRRPLDPPPVVALRLYEVTDEERADGPSEREIENVDDIHTHGLLCTVDLFPVHGIDSPHTTAPFVPSHSTQSSPVSTHAQAHTYNTDGYEVSYSRVQSSNDNVHFPSARHLHAYHQNAREGYLQAASELSPTATSVTSVPASTSASTTMTAPGPSGGMYSTIHFAPVQPETVIQPSDIVHHVEGFPITESSKVTNALVGSTFVMPVAIDYHGKKSLMFVFSDLAVKSEGFFILRYRMFDLFSRAWDMKDLVVQAECYGGMFRVYSTKEFPGLQASTELTKHLSRYGVRLNIRETERKRKKGDASPDHHAFETTGSKRKHRSSASEEGYDDDDQ
ncbi:hypothetical protein VKT23_008728 [Stygiomarasmius scandens]|uniref:Velvet domain-containing protein n=1 Tax=Marasmiellus scandens TaxID=2682957 RepID=A0ABR1JHZ7_9AGAR